MEIFNTCDAVGKICTRKLMSQALIYLLIYVFNKGKVSLQNPSRLGTHYVAKIGLELTAILLPLSPKFWDCKREAPCLHRGPALSRICFYPQTG